MSTRGEGTSSQVGDDRQHRSVERLVGGDGYCPTPLGSQLVAEGLEQRFTARVVARLSNTVVARLEIYSGIALADAQQSYETMHRPRPHV